MNPPRRSHWPLVITAAALMMITMGARQSLGLYVSPINSGTGLGIVTISFALAVGQFMWGAAQPVFGALLDRAGTVRILVIGALMMAAGLALTPFVSSGFGLVMTLGFLMAAGAGAGSFSILVGSVAQRLPAEKRPFASGFINAGGSFGQFVFAPLSQALIAACGWMVAIWTLAVACLATIPLAFRIGNTPRETPAADAPREMTLREQLQVAFQDRSYWCLHAGFFTCGFHIAFLITHLPGEVGLCGLPASVSATAIAFIGAANIAGSLGIGWLAGKYRMKILLFGVYGMRAAAVACFLAAPKTAVTFYLFGLILGMTWLATVPPTAGLVGKLFGTRYLATLFGLTLLSHQIGGFFGAWLGGLAIDGTGNYRWMWYADMALAAVAALVNLPIREARLQPSPAAA
jgi:MFS family permease